jgi:hypothetical protein
MEVVTRLRRRRFTRNPGVSLRLRRTSRAEPAKVNTTKRRSITRSTKSIIKSIMDIAAGRRTKRRGRSGTKGRVVMVVKSQLMVARNLQASVEDTKSRLGAMVEKLKSPAEKNMVVAMVADGKNMNLAVRNMSLAVRNLSLAVRNMAVVAATEVDSKSVVRNMVEEAIGVRSARKNVKRNTGRRSKRRDMRSRRIEERRVDGAFDVSRTRKANRWYVEITAANENLFSNTAYCTFQITVVLILPIY